MTFWTQYINKSTQVYKRLMSLLTCLKKPAFLKTNNSLQALNLFKDQISVMHVKLNHCQ